MYTICYKFVDPFLFAWHAAPLSPTKHRMTKNVVSAPSDSMALHHDFLLKREDHERSWVIRLGLGWKCVAPLKFMLFYLFNDLFCCHIASFLFIGLSFNYPWKRVEAFFEQRHIVVLIGQVHDYISRFLVRLAIILFQLLSLSEIFNNLLLDLHDGFRWRSIFINQMI